MNLVLKVFYWMYSFSNIQLIILIVIAPLIWGVICEIVFEKTDLKMKTWRIFCGVLLGGFVFVVFYITIGMRSAGERDICLLPFYSLLHLSGGSFQSTLLNVLLFEPIGMLAPYAFAREMQKNIGKEIVSCILISVVIEMFQYIFQLGTTEIDDIIFNALGYVIGRMGVYGLLVLRSFGGENVDEHTK